MTTPSPKMRAEFEAHMQTLKTFRSGDLDRIKGHYVKAYTASRWRQWQAAWAACINSIFETPGGAK